MKAKILECHGNYVQNTEDTLRTNSKCFFSYAKSLKKTNSLPVNMSLNDESADNRQSVCDLFARFFNSVFQDSGNVDDICDDDVTGLNLNSFTISEDDVKSVLTEFDCNKAEGAFPSLWKRSYISPNHKSGRKTDISNYRPVSIICASAKIFEKLVYKVIFAFVIASISSSQHGFYTGRSVPTNLDLSVSQCYEWWASGHHLYRFCQGLRYGRS